MTKGGLARGVEGEMDTWAPSTQGGCATWAGGRGGNANTTSKPADATFAVTWKSPFHAVQSSPLDDVDGPQGMAASAQLGHAASDEPCPADVHVAPSSYLEAKLQRTS